MLDLLVDGVVDLLDVGLTITCPLQIQGVGMNPMMMMIRPGSPLKK